jgi:DNA ligase-1
MSYNTMEIIEAIASTSSKNEKQDIISKYKGDTTFQKVLNLALNPFINFGVQQLPEPFPHLEAREFTDDTWLLLDNLASRKLTGNDAKAAIATELGKLDDNSAELLKRIIKKDLKAGFGESTVNKVIKGFIPSFPYMRCSLPKEVDLESWDWDNGIISQEKADGMFTNIDHDEFGIVTATSRQGTPLPMESFPQIVAEIGAFVAKGTQSHGEFLVVVDGKIAERAISNGIMNRVISGGEFAENETPILKLWDQIPLASVVAKGRCETPYVNRLSGLLMQLPVKTKADRHVNVIDTRIVRSLKEAYAHYKELLLQGKEGTIVKKKTGIWRDTTSKEQVKLKLEFEVELKVTGFVAGNGKNEATFGSLVCRSECDELEVAVSGFTDAKRKEVWENKSDWMGKIITVRANEILAPSESNELHSLFLPRFVEERNDKTDADDLARIFLQRESAMEAV